MIWRFTLPSWINDLIPQGVNDEAVAKDKLEELKKRLSIFKTDAPAASIVIPAYNEEFSILATLDSLSRQNLNSTVELIVVNNNSTDRTTEILELLEVNYINQPLQGTSYSRQAGLNLSKGTIVVSADADSLYPPDFVQLMIDALNKHPEVTCAYTRYSFIPSDKKSRIPYGIYESISEKLFKLRRKNKDYLNVMGFCFAYRAADAHRVGGFNISRPIWCDGWMAMSLQKIGKIHLVNSRKARVYTNDRRLLVHGSLWNAFVFRIKKEKNRISEYLQSMKPEPKSQL